MLIAPLQLAWIIVNVISINVQVKLQHVWNNRAVLLARIAHFNVLVVTLLVLSAVQPRTPVPRLCQLRSVASASATKVT